MVVVPLEPILTSPTVNTNIASTSQGNTLVQTVRKNETDATPHVQGSCKQWSAGPRVTSVDFLSQQQVPGIAPLPISANKSSAAMEQDESTRPYKKMKSAEPQLLETMRKPTRPETPAGGEENEMLIEAPDVGKGPQ